MANIKNTEKMYLDQTGLMALLDKLKEFYDEFKGNVEDVADLTDRLDELFIKGEGDNADTGIVADIQKFIKALRDEIGESTGALEDKTIYDRLAELEKSASDLVPRVEKLENESFAKVTADYDKAAKKINVKFYNAEGTELTTEKTSFEIDTTDFVIDGMIKNVHLVTINEDGGVTWPEGSDNHEVPADIAANHKGEKYLVFCFNVTENVGTGAPVNVIWVPIEALFTDYKFNQDNKDEDYVTIDMKMVHDPVANQVTATLALGQKAKDDFALVEGTFSELVEDTQKTYKGIKGLNTGLEDAEAKIGKLQDEVEKAETGLLDRTTQLETEVQTAETGLLDRTAAIENWIETKTIPATGKNSISDVFDYVVFGKISGDYTPSLPGAE